MKFYKLSQNFNTSYHTYDSCIVCAENEEEARKIHPCEYAGDGVWAPIEKIIVEELKLEPGLILSSFNTG